MKLAIIGTNFVSDSFMKEIINFKKDIEVTSVCSLKIEDAKEFAKKYNIENIYQNYKLINDVDVVYIAVPNSLHHELSVHFLKKKISVICEKPLASNIKEVENMIFIAKNNNVFLMENLMPLYNPNMKIINEFLPKLGKIRHCYFNLSKYSSRYDNYLSGENPTTFQLKFSNGALMDLGIYVVGFCIKIFGLPMETSIFSQLLDSGVDVTSSLLFKYENHNVTLQVGKSNDTFNQNEICGENGTLIIDNINHIKNIIYIDRLTKERKNVSLEVKEPMFYTLIECIKTLKNKKIEIDKHNYNSIINTHHLLTKLRNDVNIVFPKDDK